MVTMNINAFFLLILFVSNSKQFNLGNSIDVLWLFLLFVVFWSLKETCRSPLGIETGKILDSAFSSSSDAGSHSSASKARFEHVMCLAFDIWCLFRIRSETNGWCPLPKISTTTYEYLQIDLLNLTVITLIELQGKFSQQPVGNIEEE